MKVGKKSAVLSTILCSRVFSILDGPPGASRTMLVFEEKMLLPIIDLTKYCMLYII